MKVLFYLSHPADYHMFKYVIKDIIKRGHVVKIYARSKDILLELLLLDNIDYNVVKKVKRKSSLISAGLWVVEDDIKMYFNIKKFKPDILIGNCVGIFHIAKLFNRPSILMRDDDKIKELLLGNLLVLPFASVVLSPKSTYMGNYRYKQILYDGFKELAYLHPNRFIPDKKVLLNYIDLSKPFYILRFSGLSAYHDFGKRGISDFIARQLIHQLEKKGNVYITSEYQLKEELSRYILRLPAQYIHHAIYYADMYIGDSQTMAAEAAVLGTPGIRLNDFVGKLSYLERLEKKFKLTIGFKTLDYQKLFLTVAQYLNTKNLRNIFKNRRKYMLEKTIDVSEFWIWFIENYPSSINITKENPDFQYNFR